MNCFLTFYVFKVVFSRILLFAQDMANSHVLIIQLQLILLTMQGMFVMLGLHLWLFFSLCGIFECSRVSQMKTLNIFYLVIYWTQKVHSDFIFLCGIVLSHVGHSPNHQFHCWNLQDNRAVVRNFILLLKFPLDSPSYISARLSGTTHLVGLLFFVFDYNLKVQMKIMIASVKSFISWSWRNPVNIAPKKILRKFVLI